MALPLLAAAIPAVAGIAGGLMGQRAAGTQIDRANDAYARALAQISGIDVPGLTEQELQFILPEFLGEYAPQMEQGFDIAPSAMEDITIDPRLKAAQMEALVGLSQRAEEGFTAEDQMGLDIARRQAAGEAQARQEAILQNMAARGMGGSGQELMAKLQSSQQSANVLADQSQRQMLAQQQARQSAAQQAGQLGGNIRGQEFNEQSAAARSKDAINQFTAQLKAGRQSRNVGTQNQAQLRNIQERQRIAEQQAAIQNQQQQYNKQLIQQQFQNEMQKGSAMAGMYGQQGAKGYDAASGVAKGITGIAGGIGQGLTGILGSK